MCSGLCVAGKYSDAGATVCVDAGRYKPPTTTTDEDGKTTVENHLGGTMDTIRGQTGVTSCDEGARRVCTTNTACQLAGEPISCPLTAQFKGHYVRLITSACVCDAKPTLAPIALAPKDSLTNGQCLNGGKVVEDQWSGVGTGTDWCNHCMCAAGKLICTTLSCGVTTAAPNVANATAAPQAQIGKTCVNGDAIVHDGWMGRGTGSKWCKMCVCQAAVSVYTVCSQNACTDAPTTTPAPTKLDWMTMCKRGTSFMPDGWTGMGADKDWCNRCTCSKTRMSCTSMVCGANPNVCMNGHNPVPYGWVGTGKGAQWCNQCRCTKKSFVCTPKICGENPDADGNTSTPTAAPKLDTNSCVNGGVKVADGWHGPAAGDAYCNVCTCKAGALTCTEQACPPKERPECMLVACPQVAPACLTRATLPVPKRDYAGCCFDPSKDCAAATTVTTFTGEYTAAAPFLDNGGEAFVVKSETECHEQCLQSSVCLVGTFITSGSHVGECWLSANVHTKALPCDKPCRSFAKRLGPDKGGWLTTKAPTAISVPVPPSAHQRDLSDLNSGAKAFGNDCTCDVSTAPASLLVACHADLLGSGHIRVRHLSPRFTHWNMQGNEGHMCRLVRGAENSKGGGKICARRDMAGGCEKWENFACRCCDCARDGVPALINMLPRTGITLIAAGAPLLAAGEVTPTCKAHLNSVWAMCGNTEVHKWGVGPEGKAQAIKNCNWMSINKQKFGTCPNTLASCMERCTTDIRCTVGEFIAATTGPPICKLSARVGPPAPCGSTCRGFTKQHLRSDTDTVALAKTANSTLEVVTLSTASAVRLDASKGTYRAVEPYLTDGPMQVATLEACLTKCAQDAQCHYGTFITAGINANQCWLSAHGRHSRSMLCASPCQSFTKGHLVGGKSKPLLMP
jgi:hypothetical protein